MEQHFKDQIEYILDNFDFIKVRQVMVYLRWTWQGAALSPSLEQLHDTAREMLQKVAGDSKLRANQSGGLRVEKVNGYRLQLLFVVESMDGTDVVGDEVNL